MKLANQRIVNKENDWLPLILALTELYKVVDPNLFARLAMWSTQIGPIAESALRKKIFLNKSDKLKKLKILIR